MLWAVANCTESSTHTSNSSQEPFAVSHDAGMPSNTSVLIWPAGCL